MPQWCPDHPSSPVKNALLELALLERAKHLIRKRKLGAVFISGASEKLTGNIPRRTPVNVRIRSLGAKGQEEEKGGWTRSVQEVTQSTHFSGYNSNQILTLIPPGREETMRECCVPLENEAGCS